MKKRMFSMLLAIVMVVGLLPAARWQPSCTATWLSNRRTELRLRGKTK